MVGCCQFSWVQVDGRRGGGREGRDVELAERREVVVSDQAERRSARWRSPRSRRAGRRSRPRRPGTRSPPTPASSIASRTASRAGRFEWMSVRSRRHRAGGAAGPRPSIVGAMAAADVLTASAARGTPGGAADRRGGGRGGDRRRGGRLADAPARAGRRPGRRSPSRPTSRAAEIDRGTRLPRRPAPDRGRDPGGRGRRCWWLLALWRPAPLRRALRARRRAGRCSAAPRSGRGSRSSLTAGRAAARRARPRARRDVGLSTQDIGAWLGDSGKSALIGAGLAALGAARGGGDDAAPRPPLVDRRQRRGGRLRGDLHLAGAGPAGAALQPLRGAAAGRDPLRTPRASASGPGSRSARSTGSTPAAGPRRSTPTSAASGRPSGW